MARSYSPITSRVNPFLIETVPGQRLTILAWSRTKGLLEPALISAQAALRYESNSPGSSDPSGSEPACQVTLRRFQGGLGGLQLAGDPQGVRLVRRGVPRRRLRQPSGPRTRWRSPARGAPRRPRFPPGAPPRPQTPHRRPRTAPSSGTDPPPAPPRISTPPGGSFSRWRASRARRRSLGLGGQAGTRHRQQAPVGPGDVGPQPLFQFAEERLAALALPPAGPAEAFGQPKDLLHVRNGEIGAGPPPR